MARVYDTVIYTYGYLWVVVPPSHTYIHVSIKSTKSKSPPNKPHSKLIMYRTIYITVVPAAFAIADSLLQWTIHKNWYQGRSWISLRASKRSLVFLDRRWRIIASSCQIGGVRLWTTFLCKFLYSIRFHVCFVHFRSLACCARCVYSIVVALRAFEPVKVSNPVQVWVK